MQATIETRGPESTNTESRKKIGATVAAIIVVSALASALICWLVYFHAPTDVAGTHLLFLPATNALLNHCAANK